MGVGGRHHASASLRPGKRLGALCTGDSVGVEVGLGGTENLTPTGVRTVDRTARSVLITDTAARS